MNKILFFALAFTLWQGTIQDAVAQDTLPASVTSGTLSEESKVELLITYLRTLEGATFIRNNSEYKPEQAASHLQSKWQKHAARVKTAENFILKLASESSSGAPYTIRFSDGKMLPTREVLLGELQRILGNKD
jgi:hypothetical protein